jgi:hypothetical protein
VVPENPTGIEIIELAGVGFSSDAPDVALVPAVISRVLDDLLLPLIQPTGNGNDKE